MRLSIIFASGIAAVLLPLALAYAFLAIFSGGVPAAVTWGSIALFVSSLVLIPALLGGSSFAIGLRFCQYRRAARFTFFLGAACIFLEFMLVPVTFSGGHAFGHLLPGGIGEFLPFIIALVCFLLVCGFAPFLGVHMK
jgi:hypothetical protein